MIGGVFGKKNAIAPGYLGTLNYNVIAFFSQGEFVFDTHEPTVRSMRLSTAEEG